MLERILISPPGVRDSETTEVRVHSLSFLPPTVRPGPFLEKTGLDLKQNCHLACPGVAWDRSVSAGLGEIFELGILAYLWYLSKEPVVHPDRKEICPG